MIVVNQTNDKTFTAHALYGYGSSPTPLDALQALRKQLVEALDQCGEKIQDERARLTAATGPGPGRE